MISEPAILVHATSNDLGNETIYRNVDIIEKPIKTVTKHLKKSERKIFKK